MRILIQRVKNASVVVDQETISQIGLGYLIFVGIMENDGVEDVKTIVDKITNIRLFENPPGKMNESILQVKGEILLVSQFTLCATHDGGRRPSFIKAMPPERAHEIFEQIVARLKETTLRVKIGKFGNFMEVALVNNGPVTIWFDSKN